MLHFIKTSIFILTIMLLSTGCTQLKLLPFDKTDSIEKKQSLNDTITDIANQLKTNIRLPSKSKGTIAITTFVDLNLLEKTTPFGRVISESMFNELFIRGFNVADFRGKKAISINNKGEFYITRIANKLKSEIYNTYILVGTYSKIENDILINVRIIDNISGKIVASARSIYKNDYCKLYKGICPKDSANKKRKIKLITDDKANMFNIQENK